MNSLLSIRNFLGKTIHSLSKGIKGMTMVEVMVVIGIIGIVLGIGFIAMMQYRTIIRLNASARDIAGNLRVARSKAIREGNNYLVIFDEGGTKYQAGDDTFTICDDNNNDRICDFEKEETNTYYLQPTIIYGFVENNPRVPDQREISTQKTIRYPILDGQNCLSGCGPNEAGRFFITYFRDGTSDISGDIYIVPQGDIAGSGVRQDRQRSVDVIRATGRVREWRWYGTDWR